MRALRFATLAALVMLAAPLATSAGEYGRGPVHTPPKVQRYDAEKDVFHYGSNVFSASAELQPTRHLAYYGNRLTQFRFLGPSGRGGIYEALQLYYDSKKLDPKKYRYHW